METDPFFCTLTLGAAALVTSVDLVVIDFPLDFLPTNLDLLLVLN